MIELMTTVVIIGILAAVALPNYQRAIEESYWRQSQDTVINIYNGERAYFFVQTPTTYFGPIAAGATQATWRTIYVDNPNTGVVPVTFAVTAADDTTFTAKATRDNGSCAGKEITIDQDRVIGGTWLTRGRC